MDRQFHSHTGAVTKRDSALWVMSFDRVGMKLVQQEVPQLFHNVSLVSCEGTYCGRPHTYPLLSRMDPRSGTPAVCV